jgi:hypothetical protein
MRVEAIHKMINLKYILIAFLYGFLISCNQTKTEKAHTNEVSKPKIISDSTNTLTGKIENLKVETLILNYNAISCSCAQWSDSRFDKKENPDKKDYYWLEPANEKLINADHVFNGENLPIQIKVTGQIVSKNGFPKRKNLSKVSEDEAGKVFRYTKIEILKS